MSGLAAHSACCAVLASAELGSALPALSAALHAVGDVLWALAGGLRPCNGPVVVDVPN